jgi:hypothetical protein
MNWLKKPASPIIRNIVLATLTINVIVMIVIGQYLESIVFALILIGDIFRHKTNKQKMQKKTTSSLTDNVFFCLFCLLVLCRKMSPIKIKANTILSKYCPITIITMTLIVKVAKTIFLMIGLAGFFNQFINKSTHHPTNKKPHECGA